MTEPKGIGEVGLSFLLAEFRDLRKGMESRDELLRHSIDGVRADVKGLTVNVDHSRLDVDHIRSDLDAVRTDVHQLRSDVDSIQKSTESDRIRRESSWSGPRRVVQTLVLLGTAAAALLALVNFGPSVLALFAAP